MNCTNCGHPVSGNFCSNCGHPVRLRRINGKYISDEIADVLSFKKGILYTVRELLIRPGQNIRSFINEDRHRLVKPVIFVIFCSFLYTVFQQVLQFDDGYISYSSSEVTDSSAFLIMEWIQGNYGYANIIMSLFVAFWIKIMYRKHDYNLYEILILILFVFGMIMLISSVFGIFEALTGIKVLAIGGFLSTVYVAWAIGQFFDGSKFWNYIKAFFAYFLGLISIALLALVIGFLIDLI